MSRRRMIRPQERKKANIPASNTATLQTPIQLSNVSTFLPSSFEYPMEQPSLSALPGRNNNVNTMVPIQKQIRSMEINTRQPRFVEE